MKGRAFELLVVASLAGALGACDAKGTCAYQTPSVAFCVVNMKKSQCSEHAGKAWDATGQDGRARCALEGYQDTEEAPPPDGELHQFSRTRFGSCVRKDECNTRAMEGWCKTAEGTWKEQQTSNDAAETCKAAGFTERSDAEAFVKPTAP